MKLRQIFSVCILLYCASVFSQSVSNSYLTSGNSVFTGWYADPEGVVFDDEYWIYPTYSATYDEQIYMDAFSSKVLVKWTKHPNGSFHREHWLA